MPRALITINSVSSPSLNASINTLVQLSNDGNGGETTYTWAIADQPAGTADVLSSTSALSPTFTPRKEGTYLISLIVNAGEPSEARDTQIVAVRQFKTGIRVPAAGEGSEAGARGHAEDANKILQLVDKMRADPFTIVGVASGALAKNDVVRISGISTIKGGLPGQEQLPTVTKALATSSTILTEALFIVLGSVDGASGSVSSGALVLLRTYGVQLGAGVTGSAGAPVYVSDAGALALAAGTFARRVGTLVSASDALIANDATGATASGPRTVENVTGTAYTLTQQDALHKLKTTSAGAPKLITVPDDSVPIAIGAEIPFINMGAGDLEFVGDAGVEVRSIYTKQAVQWARVLLEKFGSNHWKLSGELKQLANLTIIPSPITNPFRGIGTPTVANATAPLTIQPASIIGPRGLGTPTIGLNIPATLTISPAGIVSSTKGLGTPQMVGGAAPVLRSRLSANTGFQTYYGAGQMFLNLVYQAPDWGFGGYTGALDANGWPSATITLGSGTYAGFQARIPHPGQYVALFDGTGTLGVEFGGSIVSNTSNRYVLQLDGDSSGDGPDRVGIHIRSSSAAPNNVRNLRIVPIERESDWQTVLLNPEWRACAEPFSVLRFMDFFRTNNTPRMADWPNAGWDQPDLTRVQTDWSTRIPLTYALQGNTDKGASVELAIDTCNVLNCDFWICIPLNATPNWIQGCCALIASRLNPNLKVYVEFGNELWNDAFFNGTDVMALAIAYGFPNVYDTRFGYQAMMGRYMKEQLTTLIGAPRVRHMITSHTGFDARIDITLDMPHNYGLYTDGTPAYQHAWGLATAPYIGVERGEDPATSTDSIATIISKMMTIDTPAVVADVTRNKTQATSRGLKFGAYECGQHLFNSDFGNTAIQDKLTAVNRDPAMYDCMLNYLNLIGTQMVEGPICIFTMVEEFSQYGRWGWKEDMDQVVNATPRQCPKYDAAMAWSAANVTAGAQLIAPASILGPRAIGTPSLSGGAKVIMPSSIIGPRALGTPAVTGGVAGWSALSVLSIVNPLDYGGVGNGVANDLPALENSVDALPAGGGILYLPPGTTFKKSASFLITKEHVKIWAPNGQAGILASVNGNTPDTQSIRSVADGFGIFGVVITGDATARGNTADDHMITGDNIDLVEVVGCEIDGSFASGIFMFGTTNSFVVGNYVHHTWADHIHHTFGSRAGWAWENWIFNEGPSDGDDGIACVTYGGEASTGDMEWWRNVHLGSGSGRGYTVVGGDTVNIHHNWAIGVAGAGVLIATEPAYNSESTHDVLIQENWITECAHTIGHPGILISGLYAPAGPIDDITLINNVSAGNTGANYGTEGSLGTITNTGLQTTIGALPSPKPTLADVVKKDTSILMTRDTSFVSVGSRPGLYRIHIRQSPSGSSFQQRFEYVVKGTPADVTAWISTRTAAGDILSEQRTVGGTAYALLLCPSPVTLGSGVSGVTHAELRAGDQVGSTGLSWLWNRINNADYTPAVGANQILPASILGPRAIGTPTITGGSTAINNARIFISGHSLSQNPMPPYLAQICTDLGKGIEGQIQMLPASTIKARNAGAADPYTDAVGTWNGWSLGEDNSGGPVNAYDELRNFPSYSDRITQLVIAENHYSLTSMRFSDSLPALYQYMEQYRTLNPAGKTNLYGTWLWITEAHKADMTPWIAFTRDQSKAWACLASKINDVQQANGRADRIRFIPVDAALAELVEQATTGGGLAGFTGTDTQIVNQIFDDEHLVYTEGSVHLTNVGAYFAACVMYSAIYGSSSTSAVTVPGGVTSTQAASCRSVASSFISTYYATHGVNGEYLDSAARLTFMNTFAYDYTTFIGSPGDGASYDAFFTDTSNNNPLYSNVSPPGGWWLVAP